MLSHRAKRLRDRSLDVVDHTLDPGCMSESDERIWGVGVELAEHHDAPLRFAARLATATDAVVGLHVVPELERLNPTIGREQAEAMRQRIAIDVALLLERAGIEARKDVRLIENDRPARGLVELVGRERFDALIVGRRAPSDDDPLVRLGETCRRVLRELPVPVIVVPADFGEDDRGVEPGPVVLATDLEHDASAAAFAKLLATRLERPVLVAHGIEAFAWGVSYLPAETFELMLEQARGRARTALHTWVQAQGLADAEEHVFTGDPARNVARLVEERRAAALVTGSRKLGAIQRILLASISSELAASAACPTAIVPAGASG
jgi:nucleotide-binding universal stress UspA family protein